MDLTLNLSTHAALGLFLAVAMSPALLALTFHLLTTENSE
jgi:hypothetical protein